MLDLHGLHLNEATEVLEKFLLSLEREHFYGLAYAIVSEEKHTGRRISPVAPRELVWRRVFVRGVSLSFEILMHLQGQGRSKKESKRMRCR